MIRFINKIDISQQRSININIVVVLSTETYYIKRTLLWNMVQNNCHDKFYPGDGLEIFAYSRNERREPILLTIIDEEANYHLINSLLFMVINIFVEKQF